MALKFPIFMDAQSTTPADPRVVEAMIPYFTEKFGHAASRNHSFGWEAEAGVDRAREQLARIIGARDPKELVLTSGGTESINLAIKDIAAIGRLAKDKGIIFHTDATQAVGKIPVNVETMGIDLLSCTAHLLYGPKGVGALYVRRKGPRVRIAPLIDGGGHERGMRSGTLPVPLIVGFGRAAEICGEVMAEEGARLAKLRDRLQDMILSNVDEAYLNGHPERRLPH